MSSAAHYRFTADITLRNASEYAVKKLYDICHKLYANKRNARRSNKYWTSNKVTHYVSVRSIVETSLLRFEIEDAETVRELKQIEEQLRMTCAEKPFRNVVVSIDCRHVRTK